MEGKMKERKNVSSEYTLRKRRQEVVSTIEKSVQTKSLLPSVSGN